MPETQRKFSVQLHRNIDSPENVQLKSDFDRINDVAYNQPEELSKALKVFGIDCSDVVRVVKATDDETCIAEKVCVGVYYAPDQHLGILIIPHGYNTNHQNTEGIQYVADDKADYVAGDVISYMNGSLYTEIYRGVKNESSEIPKDFDPTVHNYQVRPLLR